MQPRRRSAPASQRSGRVVGALLCALLAVACAVDRAPAPPPTRVEPVVDVLHGQEIADPYRWLEDQESPETRAWIDAQNAYAERILEPAAAFRGAFRERLTELMDRPDVGNPRVAGERQVFTLRRAGEPTASIVVRPTPGEESAASAEPDPAIDYEVLVDPLALRDDGTTSVSIVSISPDGTVLLYSVRDGGTDEIEIRALDLERGAVLPDRLPRALYGGGIRWSPESDAFMYVHRDRDRGPRLRVHRLGGDVADDSEIFGEGIGPESFLSVRRLGEERWLLFAVQHGWARHDLYLAELADDGFLPAGEPRPLLRGIDAHFDARPIDGHLYVRTDYQAPRGRLLRLDPAAALAADAGAALLGAGWEEVIPESAEVLRGFVKIDDGWVVSTLRDATSRMHVLDGVGMALREVELPSLSTASVSKADGAVRVSVSALDRPAQDYDLDVATGVLTPRQEAEIQIDADGFEVDRRWATSADGTRVPYFVMQRPGTTNDGSNRTLLNGYGGFNVALTPRFTAGAIAWVEAGGVWVHAILRGGGEFGERWHRDGWLQNKQHVFDDFIAVADDLVASGVTGPGRLAIRGGSNGGLLVASAMTQRPELFGVVLCAVPDLDMVRFFTFEHTNNKPALLEYGDASIREHFEFLRRYSPYQAVRPNTDYPATLISTGDLDTRVPPLQGRKFAARLQAASRSERPVILRYDPRRGHAGGRSRARTIDDLAASLAFAWLYLDGR